MARKRVKVEIVGVDAGVAEDYKKGLEQLYKGQWATAQKTFEKIAGGGSPVAERARQFIAVCEAERSSEPEDQDAYLSAVVAKNEGDLDAAMDYCNRGGLKGRDARYALLAAAIEALRGNLQDCVNQLEKAVELDPSSRVHAFWDPDLHALREEPELADFFLVE